MKIKVRCIDAEGSQRGNFVLIDGRVYTVIALKRGSRMIGRLTENFVHLQEQPSVQYVASRFEVVSKELIMNLEEVLERIPT